MLYKNAIGYCRRKLDLEFHQKVRRYGRVERLRHCRHFHPVGDSANSSDIRLKDACSVFSQVFSECILAVNGFADSNRDGGMPLKRLMAGDVGGGNRLLDPKDVKRFKKLRASDGFSWSPCLIGIDHQLYVRIEGPTNGLYTSHVHSSVFTAHLDLDSAES